MRSGAAFECLAWENFERLCLRLAIGRGEVVHSADHGGDFAADGRRSARDARDARLYGVRGQDQQGIDLYARLAELPGESDPERRYLCLQSRRIAKLTAAKLKKAVSDFLKGKWPSFCRVFVYATSLAAIRNELADEIRVQTERLRREGIEFEVWDADLMSPWLKGKPSLVYDFFGRAWAKRFCGSEAVRRLGTRLDARQVGELRDQMQRFYTAMFDATDSGMAGLRQADVPQLTIRDRFIPPDVLVTGQPARGKIAIPGAAADSPGPPSPASGAVDIVGAWYQQAHAWRYGRAGLAAIRAVPDADDAVPQPQDRGGLRSPFAGAAPPVRTDPDTWLASSDRHVLVGAPGSGKTTFLRHLVLDMLSDAPSLTLWTRRLGDRLPVWLPFHFFTWRQARYRDANASLAATLRAWLEQHDAASLWPMVEVALQDERLLLIVDGLDEWVSESAGRSAVAGLETFLGTREVPALVSARPYGLDRMPLAGDWDYAGIAELSAVQQRKLAGLWFDAAKPGPGPLVPESPGLDDFMAEVEGKAELRQLAATPLFLLLLVGLRLSGVPLPERRFEVYEAVVTQLLEDHPAARAAAARVAVEDGGLPADDVRQVLAHLAFRWQERGEFTPVPDSAVRTDLVAALKDPGHLAMDPQSAARMARTLTEIAEGQLGVLVRYGHQDLGFLHRVFLEELTAEHAADQLPADDRRDLFAQRACDPRWSQVLLGVLWRTRRPAENSALLQVIADQADGSGPGSLTARELLAEAVFAGFRLPAADTARHALALLDVIETHPHIPHRHRLLAASVAGLASPAGRFLRERLPRWTLAPHPLPPGLFHHLGRAASDTELGEPLWPVLVAALAMEDLACAASAAIALAGRYGAAGDTQARDGVLRALRNAATASHAAIALACLALGWPSDPATQELVTWGRRQQALPVRVTALGAVLGVLRRALTTADAPDRPVPDAQPVSSDERNWLISLLHSRDEGASMWRPVTAHALAMVLRDDPAAWDKARDDGLEILDKNNHDAFGDRGLAWATLLLCRPEDPAVSGFVCDIIRTDPHYVLFLGHALLPAVYAGHPSVAEAIEDSLRADPDAYMDSQLHALAMIDHGPAMKAALLKSLTGGGFPHWAAGALAARWGDDEEARAALRTVLEGDPVRASYAAAAAERVLGREAAVERLLALLAMPRDRQERIRVDIIAIALADIYRSEAGTPGTDAERIAAACLEHLPYPGDEDEATAEGEIIAAMGATQAARDRARAMLTRPQIPLAPLTAGYARDPDALRPVLRRLNETFPFLPAQLRAYMCTLLRDSAADRPLARDLTRRWADDPDDQVAVAASAAFHTHLRHDHDRGTLQPGEWDEALAAIRREGVKGNFRRWGQQRGAWTGALLLDELSAFGDLSGGQVPARLSLGDMLGAADMTLLSTVADGWPALRTHFGDQLLTRLSGGSLSNHDNGMTWNYLALVADRQQLLSQELAQAVTDQPALLDNDGVLAWYASTHRGDENLTDILINRLDDGTNARTLASMLLADHRDLGLAPDAVRERLRSLFRPDRLWHPPYQSGTLETLSDGFPDDDLVRKFWDMIADARKRGEPAGMHPRTYFPLAYAAAPTEELLDLLARDTERMAAWGDTYFDTHFSRAITRRFRRDASARAKIETFILAPETADAPASCFASLTAAAFSLSDRLTGNLTTRLQRQLLPPAPDMTHDYVSGADIPVPVLLFKILHPGI